MAEVGLIITAQDKALTVLKAVGTGGASALDKVRKSASAAGKAFSIMGAAATALNQAMELGKKGLEIFRMAIGDTIATALEFRGANDPVLKQFQQLGENASMLRARLGDVLIPIVQGLSDAFNSTGNRVVDFINANRKLIATNITTFLADTARLLIEGVAQGAIWVTRAWSGWVEIIGLVQAGVNTAFTVILESIAKVLVRMESLVRVFNEDLANSIARATKNVLTMADVTRDSADQAIAGVMGQIAAQEQLEQKIKEVGDVATNFVGEAQVRIEERIANSIAGSNQRRQEAIAATKELKQETDKAEQSSSELANTIGNSLGASIAAVIQGTKTMKQVFIQFIAEALKAVIAYAVKAISVKAAEGGANAAAASSSLGPVGVALAPVAAAAMYALINAYAQRFQFGGVVTGGSPNRDSVPALLMPGERVLTKRENAAYEGGMGGGGRSITVNAQVTAPIGQPSGMSDTDTKRWVLTWARQLEELVDDGLVSIGGRA